MAQSSANYKHLIVHKCVIRGERVLICTEQRQQGRHCALIHLLRLTHVDCRSAYKNDRVEFGSATLHKSHNYVIRVS
jgi:hypothetical protein